MKIDHLQERVLDYKKSIESVVEKKIVWSTTAKPLLLKILNTIVEKYAIGWKVQELNWIHNNEDVKITFDFFLTVTLLHGGVGTLSVLWTSLLRCVCLFPAPSLAGLFEPLPLPLLRPPPEPSSVP